MADLPRISLPLLGSERSADVRDSGTRLLVVYKGACPTCRLVLPLIEELYRRSEGKLDIFAVSQDSAEETEAFAREQNMTTPVLLDAPAYELSVALGAPTVPMLALLDGARLEAVEEGFDRERLRALFGELTRDAGLAWDPGKLVDDPALPDAKPG